MTVNPDQEIPASVVLAQADAAAAEGASLGDISADWAAGVASFEYVWPGGRAEVRTVELPP
jgi:hypothetical protein